jgi:hypothetical protein
MEPFVEALDRASKGSENYKRDEDSDFVNLFCKLAAASDEEVNSEEGCSGTYKSLTDYLKTTFANKSLMLQRIADNEMAIQKQGEKQPEK